MALYQVIRPRLSPFDIGSVVEKILIQHGMVLHISDKVDKYCAPRPSQKKTGYGGCWGGVVMRCARSSAPQRLFHSPAVLIASPSNRAQASVPGQAIQRDYEPRPHQHKRILEAVNSRWRTAEER